ncbi:hypothetical protein [Streptomyces sp. SS07]|uniref:hypothetical protein n=1 Tax=Streptomyces sp. SS07 TaxID=2015315 RepID=UPI000B5C8EDD|nr:hypothetical protein [Streptomyces sp. SS07]
MARLQILELPEGADDDRPPFVLVIDEVAFDNPVYERFVADEELATGLASRVGARAVLVFEDTIDIPANDTSAYAQPAAVLHLDDHEVRSAIATDMNKARRQAGVATIGQRLADERTDIARDMDRLANHKAAITDALGLDRLRDWDDIRNAAAGIRRDREAKTEAVENVRNLHRPVEHRGQTICWECSGYDFPGQTTDSTPVTHDQCSTLRALNAERDETSPSRG